MQPASGPEAERPRPLIVGIGASAGGLEAIQSFLSTVPPDTGFVYVVVQHLAPRDTSMLAELLGHHAQVPVIEAEPYRRTICPE